MAGAMSPGQPRSVSWKNFDLASRSARPTFSTTSSPSLSTTSTSPETKKKKKTAEYSGISGLSNLSNWAQASSSKMPSGEIDWENGDYFMACTMKQLRELDNETIDAVRVVKSYIGPPPSPARAMRTHLTLEELRASFSDAGSSEEEEDASDSDVEVTAPADEETHPALRNASVSDEVITTTAQADSQIHSAFRTAPEIDESHIHPAFRSTLFTDEWTIRPTYSRVQPSQNKAPDSEIGVAPTSQTYFQTPPAQRSVRESLDGITPFPLFIDEDLCTDYSGSLRGHRGRCGHYSYDGYKADGGYDGDEEAEEQDEQGEIELPAKSTGRAVENEEETTFDVKEPEMNLFRLWPMRPDLDLAPYEINYFAGVLPLNSLVPDSMQTVAFTLTVKLARFKGTRNYGFQVVGTNLPYTHDSFGNLSDYYEMPLIEYPDSMALLHADKEVVEYVQGEEYILKPVDKEEEAWLRPASQPPAKSLVLYLYSTGIQPKDIMDLFVTLEPRFITEKVDRYFNSTYIPEHWQMNADTVKDIIVKTTTPDASWEVIRGFRDKVVTVEMRRRWFNDHEYTTKLWVRAVLEDYVYLRFATTEKKELLARSRRYEEQLIGYSERIYLEEKLLAELNEDVD